MAFVFYDLETSGTDTRFDQILHFAAIRTDADLNIEERVEFRCRLDPHVVPHPEALLLTRRSLADVRSAALPSHYQMVCAIVRCLENWAPATLVGFNSIAFDERMLSNAFYKTLHPPYLTSRGYVRADALTLCRAVAFYAEGVLTIPQDEDSKPRFKLGMLHEANGGGPLELHSAMADAEATLELCRLVRNRDEECWSRFLRFSAKAAVCALIDDGQPFGVVRFRGNTPVPAAAVVIGRVAGDANLRIGVDLSCDLDALATASPDVLDTLLDSAETPVFELRTNACPAVCDIWDLPEKARAGLDDAACDARAARLVQDPLLGARILERALARRPVYSTSPHVEAQLYDALPNNADDPVLRAFHGATWANRPALVAQLADSRSRRLGIRLMLLEAPEVLEASHRDRLRAQMALRVRRGPEAVPWRTIDDAREAIAALGEFCPAEMRDAFDGW